MNQGKLEVVKQMARVNINILGISELRWTGMGEFNSDDFISTAVGRNPLLEQINNLMEEEIANHFSILALRTP